MLAWRIVTRLATTGTIRQGSLLQRRFIHPSRFQVHVPQPNTLLAKLRFRPDGTPRSKLIAFGFGCLILSNCFTIFEHLNYKRKDEPVRNMFSLMSGIILIQHTNSTYDSVDFGDAMSVITYFKKLCQASTGYSEEDIDTAINNLMVQIIDKETRDGSIKYPAIKALSIMKWTADKIHGAFQELGWDGDDFTADTAHNKIPKIVKIVSSAMDEAAERLESLADLDSDPE